MALAAVATAITTAAARGLADTAGGAVPALPDLDTAGASITSTSPDAATLTPVKAKSKTAKAASAESTMSSEGTVIDLKAPRGMHAHQRQSASGNAADQAAAAASGSPAASRRPALPRRGQPSGEEQGVMKITTTDAATLESAGISPVSEWNDRSEYPVVLLPFVANMPTPSFAWMRCV